MLLIIVYHFNLHTVFTNMFDQNSVTFLLHEFCLDWGETSVLAFILISGYYLITQPFKLKKIINIVIVVTFYSIVLTIVAASFNIIQFDGHYALEMIFPIISTSYWFVTYYIVLLLLQPFLNILLNGITKSRYILLLSLLIFLTVMTKIIPVTPMISSSQMISLILAYSIGGYFRRFPSIITNSKKTGPVLITICVIYSLLFNHYLIDTYYKKTVDITYGYWPFFIFMIISLIVILVILLWDRVQNKTKYLFIASISLYLISLPIIAYTKQWGIINDFKRPDCGFCLISAIGLFLLFKNLKPNSNKVINWIAASTLSIYIIHDSNTVRTWLWNTVIKGGDALSKSVLEFTATMMLSVFSIFAVCVIIDRARHYLIFNPFRKLIDKYHSVISDKIKTIEARIDGPD